MTDKIDKSAPERIWAVYGLTDVLSFNVYDNGGAEYIRADIAQDQRQRAEEAEAERNAFRWVANFQQKVSNALRSRAEKAEAEAAKYKERCFEADGFVSDLEAERDDYRQRAEKADEYHAIANAYAAWAGDMLDAIEGRIGELDPDSHSDQQLRTLIDRAEAGIAAETRRVLRQDEGDEE